jgi:phosphoglycolate phosphatase
MYGKSSKIEKLLRKSKTEKYRAVVIGDEGRDIDAAQKSGVDSGAVTWGYNHQGALEKHRPTYVFRSMDEILLKLGNQ